MAAHAYDTSPEWAAAGRPELHKELQTAGALP